MVAAKLPLHCGWTVLELNLPVHLPYPLHYRALLLDSFLSVPHEKENGSHHITM